jgi:uncharacterized membrane-anchored protein
MRRSVSRRTVEIGAIETTPADCETQALKLLDLSIEAERRGQRVKAKRYFERARELLAKAKKLALAGRPRARRRSG